MIQCSVDDWMQHLTYRTFRLGYYKLPSFTFIDKHKKNIHLTAIKSERYNMFQVRAFAKKCGYQYGSVK